MLKGYLIVEKSALPDFFIKVLTARRLLESGECSQVSDAVKLVGISRSTYYKYKDRILEPTELTVGHKAVLSMLLNHEAGALSRTLSTISQFGASVLTITQSLPINGKASVTVTLDLQGVNESLDLLLEALSENRGAEAVRLIAVE
jgi:chorismate mutase